MVKRTVKKSALSRPSPISAWPTSACAPAAPADAVIGVVDARQLFIGELHEIRRHAHGDELVRMALLHLAVIDDLQLFVRNRRRDAEDFIGVGIDVSAA